MNRRQVVATIASGLAVASISSHGATGTTSGGRRAAAMPLVINSLGFLYDPNVNGGESLAPLSVRNALDGGVNALNLSMGYVSGPDEPFERSVRDIARWDAIVRADPTRLMKIWRSADVATARSEGKLGLAYTFQNAAMLGEGGDRVELFANLGVRVVGLTYNTANQIGDGAASPQNGGLTKVGRAVVEHLNEQRVIVDLSHSSERTSIEAARASRAPVSINHTGCRALVDFARNKSDEALRLVASRGGYIGIYFMYFLVRNGRPAVADVIAHLDHAINVCGEDHVGIGTDGCTIAVTDLAAYEQRFAKDMEERRARGIAAPGERPDTLPFVVDLQGPEQFPALARHLDRHGYTAGRIEKVLGLNYLRFSRDVWGE